MLCVTHNEEKKWVQEFLLKVLLAHMPNILRTVFLFSSNELSNILHKKSLSNKGSKSNGEGGGGGSIFLLSKVNGYSVVNVFNFAR